MRAVQNDREWWLHPEVALRGEFAEFETVVWLREVIKPGDTVIDVGANVGQMTLEMAYLVGPEGKVFAVEPGPGNLRVLRQHVAANGYSDRVEIIEAACSDVNGQTVELKIYGESTEAVGSGHTLMANYDPTETELDIPAVLLKVDTISLDWLCAGDLRPNVIKIDVEGAEVLVLRGAQRILELSRPAIRFGFHTFAFADPIVATQEIRKILKGCEYEICGDTGKSPFLLAEYVASPRAVS